jgi:hypothetical protein
MTDYRRNFIAGGSFYPEHWAGDVSTDGGHFGERL